MVANMLALQNFSIVVMKEMIEVTTNILWRLGSTLPIAHRGLSLYDLTLFS